ncbi:IS3 family transposase [Listeria welshimeri]|nr:IS3 family transposase [Listeria welshimeri]
MFYDNVLIESFFSHLKTEVFYSQDFTATNEQIIELVEEYIYYYNNERIQLKLNKLPRFHTESNSVQLKCFLS